VDHCLVGVANVSLNDLRRIPLGMNPTGTPILLEEVAEILDINLLSAIHCTRAAGQHLLAQGRGKVITISGAVGLAGRPGMSLYGTAKHGLTGLTRALALEWAPYGIRVNAIAPGHFPDIITAGEEGYAAAERRALDVVPLRRLGHPREVGLLALYLASPASDYMTGQVLTLDGGVTI
jgi:NAD(P)-dependent dehydrogenase (short-subunit alcohol dehydrogenase family)